MNKTKIGTLPVVPIRYFLAIAVIRWKGWMFIPIGGMLLLTPLTVALFRRWFDSTSMPFRVGVLESVSDLLNEYELGGARGPFAFEIFWLRSLWRGIEGAIHFVSVRVFELFDG